MLGDGVDAVVLVVAGVLAAIACTVIDGTVFLGDITEAVVGQCGGATGVAI